MFGVGRDLCGSPSPTPCPSTDTQSRLHSTASRRVLNISREGDSTASLGSLFQVSITLRGKKFFLMFSWNFLCSSLCPLPLVLSLGTTAKSLAPYEQVYSLVSVLKARDSSVCGREQGPSAKRRLLSPRICRPVRENGDAAVSPGSRSLRARGPVSPPRACVVSATRAVGVVK